VVEASGYRGEVDSGVRVEGSAAGPQEEAATEAAVVSDREKLAQALEERDRLDRVVEYSLSAHDQSLRAHDQMLRALRMRMDLMAEELARYRDTHPPRESAQARPADGEAAS
jgi:septal ring factor EnvC (AmiA/AmiB activator)